MSDQSLKQYIGCSSSCHFFPLSVTADHGHGFDVYGGADTHYLQAKETDAEKRSGTSALIRSMINPDLQFSRRHL